MPHFGKQTALHLSLSECAVCGSPSFGNGIPCRLATLYTTPGVDMHFRHSDRAGMQFRDCFFLFFVAFFAATW